MSRCVALPAFPVSGKAEQASRLLFPMPGRFSAAKKTKVQKLYFLPKPSRINDVVTFTRQGNVDLTSSLPCRGCDTTTARSVRNGAKLGLKQSDPPRPAATPPQEEIPRKTFMPITFPSLGCAQRGVGSPKALYLRAVPNPFYDSFSIGTPKEVLSRLQGWNGQRLSSRMPICGGKVFNRSRPTIHALL
jgi:hypothetical protein